MTYYRIAGTLVTLVLLATGGSDAHEVWPVCGLTVPEEENRKDALALQVELGRTELIAAQEIFELLEKLWADEATERMRYLDWKHRRDSARAELALRQAHLARQEAYVDWLIELCSGKSRGGSGQSSTNHEAAQERYFAADCEARRRDIDLAEVEREWAGIWLASIRDLREHNVATRPDIIEAEYDVRMAEQRMKTAVARAELCEKPKPASD